MHCRNVQYMILHITTGCELHRLKHTTLGPFNNWHKWISTTDICMRPPAVTESTPTRWSSMANHQLVCLHGKSRPQCCRLNAQPSKFPIFGLSVTLTFHLLTSKSNQFISLANCNCKTFCKIPQTICKILCSQTFTILKVIRWYIIITRCAVACNTKGSAETEKQHGLTLKQISLTASERGLILIN